MTAYCACRPFVSISASIVLNKGVGPCRHEPAAAGTKRPRSQDDAEPPGDLTSTADAPAALVTADAALSESADTAAVAAAIAATHRADAVLHNVRPGPEQIVTC